MKKSFKDLSLVLVVMFMLTSIPVSAGFNGSEAVQAMYLDFETNADVGSKVDGGAVGQIAYYKWASGENVGANGTGGALKICPAAVTNESSFSSGFQTTGALATGDTVYNLSFKYMVKTDGREATLYPLVRATSSSGTVTKVANLAAGKYDAETFAYENQTANASGTSVTTVADGNWYEYNWQFKLDGTSGFGIGSSSQVTVDSMSAFRVCFRLADDGKNGEVDATSEVYIDDLVVEPVVEAFSGTPAPYVAGDELLSENGRKMISVYNSAVANQGSYNSVAADGTITAGDKGRGVVSEAGKTGDPAYVMVASQASNVAFYSNGYTLEAVEGNKVYQFSARLKAPAVTVDETLDTDNVFYVDAVTGEVKGKSAAVVNNYIGAQVSFNVKFSNYTANGAFTGYIDANGNYVDFAPNATAPNGGRPSLTTEWVDYVGYFMVPATDEVKVNNQNGINITVTGPADKGIMYVDEMSLKPYTGENLIPNGDFALTTVGGYNNTTVSKLPLFFRDNTVNPATSSNYQIQKESYGEIFVFQSFANPKVLPFPVQIEAGKTYRLTIEAKTRNTETGKFDIALTKGENTMAITSETTPSLVKNSHTTHEFIITPTADYAVEGDVAPVLNIKYLPDGPEGNKAILYKKIQLVEMPTAVAENITVSGELTEGKTITANWTKFPADSTATQIVKISVGDDTNGFALIDTSATTSSSKAFIIPTGYVGKKLKFEVISYVEGDAISAVSYTTADAIAEAPEVIEGVVITDAAKGDVTFSANVSYIGEDDAFILVATYDANGRMVNLLTFDLAKDGTVTPVSITNAGATSAKVMVFDGANLTETNIIPMCEAVEIR